MFPGREGMIPRGGFFLSCVRSFITQLHTFCVYVCVCVCMCVASSDKGKVDIFKKTGTEIGRQAASKSGGLFSAEDWQCAM